jgi:uncharacterized protein (TIGR02996 family)
MTDLAPTVADLERAVLLDPDADDLRLILADTCDDAGDHARAEYVRAGVERARSLTPDSWRRVLLAEDELENRGHPRPFTLTLASHDPGPTPLSPTPPFGFHRGLPEVWSVRDVPTFEREARDVFSRWPIRRVVLRCEVQRILRERRAYHVGVDLAASVSHRKLFNMLSGRRPSDVHRVYQTEAQARSDLEYCMVRYGRLLAGLPELGSVW